MNKTADINEIQHEILKILKEVESITDEKIVYYLGYGTALGAVRNKGFIPWDSDVDIVVIIDDYYDFLELVDNNISERYEVVSLGRKIDYDSLKARISRKDTHHSQLHVDIFPMVGAPKSKIDQYFFSKTAYWNYRSHFFKKVNPKINYKNNLLKQIISYILKLLLLPFPEKIFINIFNKLSREYSVKEATELYNICGSYGNKEFIPKEWLGNPEYMDFEREKFPVPEKWDKYLTHVYGDYMVPKKEDYV